MGRPRIPTRDCCSETVKKWPQADHVAAQMIDITPLAASCDHGAGADHGSACLGHRADGHVNAYPCLPLAPVAPVAPALPGDTDGGR
jgi:hypothetical protein